MREREGERERDAEKAHPSKKIIINVIARRIRSGGMVGTDKGLTSSLPRVRWLKRAARGTRANLDKSRPNDERPRGCRRMARSHERVALEGGWRSDRN